MIFGFTIPGQPPTGNLLYDTVWRYNKQGDRYLGRAKRAGVGEYQLIVANAAHKAMPEGWDPGEWEPQTGKGLIVVRTWFYLARAVDADNATKVIHDGIKVGLGTKVVKGRAGPRVVPIYDDERFLGQAWWLENGHKDDARVEVAIITGWTGLGGAT